MIRNEDEAIGFRKGKYAVIEWLEHRLNDITYRHHTAERVESIIKEIIEELRKIHPYENHH